MGRQTVVIVLYVLALVAVVVGVVDAGTITPAQSRAERLSPSALRIGPGRNGWAFFVRLMIADLDC